MVLDSALGCNVLFKGTCTQSYGHWFRESQYHQGEMQHLYLRGSYIHLRDMW
jgi:hypothetical protein